MKNNNGAQRNDKMGKITLAILMSLTMGNIAMAQRALPETGLSALSVKLSDSAKDSSGASSKLSEFFDHSLTRKNKEASPVYLGQQDLNANRAAGHEEQALNTAQSGAPVCPGCGGAGPVTAPATRNKSAWEKIKLARPGAVPALTTVDTAPQGETNSQKKKNDIAGLNKETSVVGAVVAGAVTGAMVGAIAGGGGAVPGAVVGAIVGGAGAAVSNVVEIIVAHAG